MRGKPKSSLAQSIGYTVVVVVAAIVRSVIVEGCRGCKGVFGVIQVQRRDRCFDFEA